LPEWYRRFRH